MQEMLQLLRVFDTAAGDDSAAGTALCLAGQLLLLHPFPCLHRQAAAAAAHAAAGCPAEMQVVQWRHCHSRQTLGCLHPARHVPAGLAAEVAGCR